MGLLERRTKGSEISIVKHVCMDLINVYKHVCMDLIYVYGFVNVFFFDCRLFEFYRGGGGGGKWGR